VDVEIAVAVLIVDGEGSNQPFTGEVFAQEIRDDLIGVVDAVRSHLAIFIQQDPLIEQQHIMAGNDWIAVSGAPCVLVALLFLMLRQARPNRLLEICLALEAVPIEVGRKIFRQEDAGFQNPFAPALLGIVEVAAVALVDRGMSGAIGHALQGGRAPLVFSTSPELAEGFCRRHAVENSRLAVSALLCPLNQVKPLPDGKILNDHFGHFYIVFVIILILLAYLKIGATKNKNGVIASLAKKRQYHSHGTGRNPDGRRD
jgi:hypothetical protein